jgi:transposase
MIKHTLKLDVEEREELLKLVKTGKSSAAKLTHARILLAADESIEDAKTDIEIAKLLLVSVSMVQRIRSTAVESGLTVALERKARTTKKALKVDGEKEAHLISICCSTPPEGRSRWTLQLLANELVRLEIFDEISKSTVQRTLKKMNLSLG